MRALSATEAERVKDRLGAFAKYGRHGDLKLMDELFRLGSTYREFDSRGVDKQVGCLSLQFDVVLNFYTCFIDEFFLENLMLNFDNKSCIFKEAGEILIDESIILKTIRDKGLGNLKMCRGLLDCIHGGG